MTPKLFTPGQEVTLKENYSKWETLNDGPADGPRFGEIVMVTKHLCFYEGKWYMNISGYVGGYPEQEFVPVVSDHVLEEELSQLTVGV